MVGLVKVGHGFGCARLGNGGNGFRLGVIGRLVIGSSSARSADSEMGLGHGRLRGRSWVMVGFGCARLRGAGQPP